MQGRDHPERKKRRRIVYSVAFALVLVIGAWLFWSLRDLFLPCVVGALLAYVSSPAIRRLRRMGLPQSVAVLILAGSVIGAFTLLGLLLSSALPDELGTLELRTRMRVKFNQRYNQAMGLQAAENNGNVLFKTFGSSVLPIHRRVNEALRLTDEEAQFLNAHRKPDTGDKMVRRVSERVWSYHQMNQLLDLRLFGTKDAEVDDDRVDKGVATANDDSPFGGDFSAAALFTTMLSIISLWAATPFVFLFLLIDDGNIKRWVIDRVPNRYFELTLTTIDCVDGAIGSYLRGTFLQCSLVGLTFFVCLWASGFPFTWALLIGAVAGVANAIPFLGPVIGLVAGMSYALIAEDVNGLLPFTSDTLFVAVLLTVGIVQALDNAVFQPIVLGGAVNLHPLVVILGVMGGSILFGFAGMLFAIPAIVVVKVVFSTTLSQLRAYRLI